MKLANPFPPKTREWFRDCWQCWQCGENGQRTGGLELHHITGRDSSSTFNGAILCKRCHAHAKHTNEEEALYTEITIKYLYNLGYPIQDIDLEHIERHPWLITPKLVKWIT